MVLVVLCSVTGAAARPRKGQPPEAAPQQSEAAVRLAEARRLQAEQKFQQAYEQFTAAYQLMKQPALLLEMCMCQISQSKADEAESLAQQYEREVSGAGAAPGPGAADQELLQRCKLLTRQQRLMVQGAQQCDSDRYREGIKNLVEADRIGHAPDLSLNIGLCYIKDRNLAEAERACNQFKAEVQTPNEEQRQSLAFCERGIALLREYYRCLDSFSQRTYKDARALCLAVNQEALDDSIQLETLLRVGFSQSRLGEFRQALDRCTEYERRRPNRTPDEDRLLSECKLTANKGLAPPPPPPRMVERRPWYKKWWVWTLVGAGVGGLAVGLGVGLGAPRSKDYDVLMWEPALTQRR